MELDKYYIGVDNEGEIEKREVVKIDFLNSQFTVTPKVPGQPNDVFIASQVIPMDKRGRKRLNFNYNLQKGLNLYKQPLINALKSTDEVISTYENSDDPEELVSSTTYRKAIAVKEQLLGEMAEVVMEYADEISEHLPSEYREQLEMDLPETEVTEVVEVVDPEEHEAIYNRAYADAEAEFTRKYNNFTRQHSQQQPNHSTPLTLLISLIRKLLK